MYKMKDIGNGNNYLLNSLKFTNYLKLFDIFEMMYNAYLKFKESPILLVYFIVYFILAEKHKC